MISQDTRYIAARAARPILYASQLAERHGGHFFDPDTMRGFGSRVLDTVIPAAGGGRSYFVTSERDRFGSAWGGQRRYTVRVISWASGAVDEPDTDGFGAFTYSAAAIRRARSAAHADTAGAGAWPCPVALHRRYGRPVTHRGRAWCDVCIDEVRRVLGDRRMPSAGPVTISAAVAVLRATRKPGAR